MPSGATVRLIVDTFGEIKKRPSIGRAEALRRAELGMPSPETPPEFAHPPMMWAPFVLAGEGLPSADANGFSPPTAKPSKGCSCPESVVAGNGRYSIAVERQTAITEATCKGDPVRLAHIAEGGGELGFPCATARARSRLLLLAASAAATGFERLGRSVTRNSTAAFGALSPQSLYLRGPSRLPPMVARRSANAHGKSCRTRAPQRRHLRGTETG